MNARAAPKGERRLTVNAGALTGLGLFALASAVLLVSGVVAVEAHRHDWYASVSGIALVVVIELLLAGVLVWLHAQAVNRLEARLSHLNRIYALLSDIGALFNRARSREELFSESCRIAVARGLFRFAWIAVIERGTRRMYPAAWAGGDDDFLAATIHPDRRHVSRIERHGPFARAARRSKPVISNNVLTDESLPVRDEMIERGIRSVAVLPIVLQGETVAVFALHADVPYFFNDEEVAVLVDLAHDIGFALDHLEKERTLQYLAQFDPLTGVANEARLRERLQAYLKGIARNRSRLALIIFDIERFKMVNDTFGRKVGDELLKQVATRLETWAGPGRLARIGSNQFAAMITRVAHDTDIAHIYERALNDCFERPYRIDAEELRISARVGIAVFPQDGIDENALISNAEGALKTARELGERCVFYNPQINAKVAERLRLETRLREAVQQNRFTLHYQPKVDVRTRQLTGVEALIRWHDPETGLVPPLKLIPLLEETGLIREVGQWVIRQAVADLARFAEHGVTPGVVAVNVSALQLRQEDFVPTVADALVDPKFASMLELEITESVLMRDIDKNLDKLSAIKALGARISIDDFGTGYSSMAYLAKLPVDCLKIDKTFVQGLQEQKTAMTLVSTMISLAHSLGLEVVAEGVESEEQANVLRLLNCDQMQGFLICKPLPLPDAVAFLKEGLATTAAA